MKRALDAMVFDCKTDNEAAVETGLTISAIRIALKQPATRSYYREQLQVLRERESAANIHALVEVRNQKSNQMARVQAVKALEQISEDAPSTRGSVSLPGLVIVVNTGAGNGTATGQIGEEIPQPMRIVHDVHGSKESSD